MEQAGNALEWNNSVFEIFASTILEVLVDPSAVCKNRHVRQGKPRAVATTGMLRITSMLMVIPPVQHIQFYFHVQRLCSQVIAAMTQLPEDSLSHRHLLEETSQLASSRYSYRAIPGCFSAQFGGVFGGQLH